MNKVNSLVWRNMINEGIWMEGIGISRGGGAGKYDQRRGRAKGKNRKRYAHIFIKEKLQHIRGGIEYFFFFSDSQYHLKKNPHALIPSIHPSTSDASQNTKQRKHQNRFFPFFLLCLLTPLPPSPTRVYWRLLGCSGYRWFWYDCA